MSIDLVTEICAVDRVLMSLEHQPRELRQVVQLRFHGRPATAARGAVQHEVPAHDTWPRELMRFRHEIRLDQAQEPATVPSVLCGGWRHRCISGCRCSGESRSRS